MHWPGEIPSLALLRAHHHTAPGQSEDFLYEMQSQELLVGTSNPTDPPDIDLSELSSLLATGATLTPSCVLIYASVKSGFSVRNLGEHSFQFLVFQVPRLLW